MKTLNFFYCMLFLLLLYSCGDKDREEMQDMLKLWYNQPADATVPDDPNGWNDDHEWLKALPLGNGSLGVMVFGDVNKERIQLNEESMWSGSPDDNNNPEAPAYLDEIRHLLFEGKYREAGELTNRTQICRGEGTGHGNGATVPYGSFQTLGDLWIDFGQDMTYENYYRELDLNDAVVRLAYTQNGVNFRREIFTSQPGQVMVARFTADKPGQITFSCKMNRPEHYRTYSENEQLVMTGALKDGKGGENLRYMARLKAINKNGRVTYNDSTLSVKNADEVILLLAASTDYMLDYPLFKGRKYADLTNESIAKAAAQDYEALLQNHLKEYQAYFSRVSLDIGSGETDRVPTNERLERFKETGSDPHLVELLFQYGRYLLISSSRPGTLPANLQGLWTNKIQSPWNGDYHTNINVQMNYWPAEVTNLPEMHLPLFDFVEMISEPGAETARVQYRMDGWVLHPVSNIWGYTSPGEVASWGLHSGGAAWISSHIFEHYAFTQDLDFLARMWPVLEDAVKFYLEWLVAEPGTGRLVSGPAVSPENTFIAPDGSHCQVSMGPAHDQQVIWQLFSDYLDASEILGIENDMLEKVAGAKERLAGPEIGEDGRLMEWRENFAEAEPGHRHISHLFAMHPGSQINIKDTPGLMQAAEKSLDYRLAHGGGHTGWSAAWLISQYARLAKAQKAKESLNTVISKSTSPNLFGQHPPFQMDANFGTTAGIAEMLIQSHAGYIHLLPALPVEWSEGSVKGLKARGGFTVDMAWEKGELVKVIITSQKGKPCEVMYQDRINTLSIEEGESIVLDWPAGRK